MEEPEYARICRDFRSGSSGCKEHAAPSLEELRRTQWCPEFEQLMRNRLIMGFLRYGGGKERKFERCSERIGYKNVESAIKRLHSYLENGNQEHLVDAANLCVIEFCFPGSHPNPHFSALDGEAAERHRVEKT